MRKNKDRIARIQQLIRDPEYNGFYLDDLETGGPINEGPLIPDIPPPPQTQADNTFVSTPPFSIPQLESQEEYGFKLDTEIIGNQLDSDINILNKEPFVDYAKIKEKERIVKENVKLERFNANVLNIENIPDLQTKLQGAGFKMPISFRSGTPDGIIGAETITTLQRFLKRKGFGKYLGKYGVDGKMGNMTMDALDEYNKSIIPKAEKPEVVDWYKSNTYKPDVFSFAGKCKEEQCASFLQMHLTRQLKLPIDNIKSLGIYGDAWHFRENILNSGGTSIFDRKTDYIKGDFNKNNKLHIQKGDILSVELLGIGSPARGEALKEANTPETHTAIIDKVFPDGSFNTVENLHSSATEAEKRLYKISKGKKGKRYQGKVYVKKVNSKTGVYGSKVQPLQINYITRPDYSNIQEEIIKTNLNVGSFDASNKIQINGDVPPALSKVVRSMNSPELKKNILEDFNINEEEYNTLAKALVGIAGKETKFGGYTWKIPKLKGKIGDIEASTILRGKQVVSLGAKTLTNLGLTRKEGVLNQPYDVSRGIFKFKYMDNFNQTDQSLLKTYGVDKSLLSAKSQFVSAIYKLSKHYNYYKKEFSPEEALYRAIAIYNKGSLDEEANTFIDEKDLDYVNKVLEFSKIAEIIGSSNNKKLTSIDLLNNSQEVIMNNVLRKHR